MRSASHEYWNQRTGASRIGPREWVVVVLLGLVVVGGLVAVLFAGYIHSHDRPCVEAYKTQYLDRGTAYDMGQGAYCKAYNQGTKDIQKLRKVQP
jgi:type IV secretory pathway TrbF-like protein